ncbi:MAG: hypothetical protein COC06_11275 [Bacteroidales bacterium]|nr:MAG: hypothetical protein COC06_11275 [Bacteroidales bacterium]
MKAKFRKIRLLSGCNLIKILCVVLFQLFITAQNSNASNRFSYVTAELSLKEFIEELGNQTDYNFLFNEAELQSVTLKKTISYKNRPIDDVLKDINVQIPIVYTFDKKNIAIRLGKNKPEESSRPGKLSGHIYDKRNAPLLFANVVIEKLQKGTTTGLNGDYNMELSPGIYTVSFSYLGYITQRITEVTVKAGKTTMLDVNLQPTSEALQEVTITSNFKIRVNTVAALNVIRKNEVTAIDGITHDQITLAPVSNVAEVLKRISGLNIQKNKYVAIRGISERYNNAMMNGVLMPSTEANRRNYSFDIIPSSLISSVVVNKTASPKLTAEFTGGLVNINTIEIPSENFFTIKVGTGGSKNTFGDFYALPRHKNDYWALNSDEAKLPDIFYSTVVTSNRYDVTKRREFSIAMPGNGRFHLNKYKQMPNQSYELSFGRVSESANNNRFGMIGAITYKNKQSKEDYMHDATGSTEYIVGNKYKFMSSWGGIYNMSYTFKANKIQLKNTLYQKLHTSNSVYDGLNLYVGNIFRGFSEQRIINSLLQNVLEGEHALGKNKKIRVNWKLGRSGYTRDQPNNQLMEGTAKVNAVDISFEAGGVYRAFDFSSVNVPYRYLYTTVTEGPPYDYHSKYNEKRYTASIDFEIPLSNKNPDNKFQFGYDLNIRNADFIQYRLGVLYDYKGFESKESWFGSAVNDLYTQEVFNEGRLYYTSLYSGTSGADAAGNGYEAEQYLHAFYGGLDFYATKKLHISGGLRIEKNKMEQEVKTPVRKDEDGNPESVNQNVNNVDVDDFDLVPSVNFIYELTPKTNLRASYFRSLARPEFTELGTYSYFDFEDRITYRIGGFNTKNVVQTTIDNAELRWEFYPSSGESFSVSAFYKYFDKPIEVTVVSSSSSSVADAATYSNLEKAYNYGLEFDFRKSFGFLGKGFKNLYLFGNGSFIWSRIFYDRVSGLEAVKEEGGITYWKEITTESSRMLYGQTPYIINGGLNYKGTHFGGSLTYNRVGPRIIMPHYDDMVSQWEKPRNLLGLQLRYSFLKDNRAELKLNLSDLLNENIIIYHNNVTPEGRGRKEFGLDENGQGIVTILNDPSGDSYDSEYDFVKKRYKKQRSFSLSFKYRF